MARLMPIAALLALAALPPVAGADERSTPETTGAPAATALPPDVTARQIQAIESGLLYLAEHQNSDGSFNEEPAANIAVTSLALLAFMASGHGETRGRHSASVREGVKFLLRHVTRPGAASEQLPAGYIHMEGDEQSRMHGHGYATLALALAYGMSDPRRRGEIRDALLLAVPVIERSQDGSGGWYYYPTPRQHEGSVTVCMVQALRAARDAGIPVRKEVVDRGVSYLEKSQDPATGGFCYSLDIRHKQTYALTAAALAALFGYGEYGRDRMVSAGLEYLMRYYDESLMGYQGWFFYANLYAAQAIWQAAADPKFARFWRTWWPRMRDHLLDDQGPGETWWSERGGMVGGGTSRAYATACACLILSVPLEILPIFER